jgi:hypothetical protein
MDATIMVTNIQELSNRVNRIEEQKNQEIVTLVEILANATFFGGLKKSKCDHAKQGQCSFFTIERTVEKSIPIVSECKIKDCKQEQLHYHIELSNITCSLCPNLVNEPTKRKTSLKINKHPTANQIEE